MKQITFTFDDWAEIEEALRLKAALLRNGYFGESAQDCNVAKWAGHLDNIRRKIGDGGERATKLGIAPGRHV